MDYFIQRSTASYPLEYEQVTLDAFADDVREAVIAVLFCAGVEAADDDDDRRLAVLFVAGTDTDRFLLCCSSAFGAIFFKCSTRCVVLLMLSNECRLRVMIFLSLNSATSALRVR